MAVRYPGKCFWAVILLWAVAIAAVWSCRTATAYELHRWKYDHPAITVFDMSNVHGSECARDFNDEAPAREALGLWTAHGNVQYVDAFALLIKAEVWAGSIDVWIECGSDPDISPYADVDVVAVNGVVVQCTIRLNALFFALDYHWQVNVLAHELGHCLGVYHSTEAGIMKMPRLFDFSADDAAAIAALYPYPERLVVNH